VRIVFFNLLFDDELGGGVMTSAVLEIDLDPVLAGGASTLSIGDLFGCDKPPDSLREIDGRNLLVGEQN
jgi:hypothetical protein